MESHFYKDINEKEILKAWMDEVWNKSAEIDPANELCWRSLAIGYLLGKGLKVGQLSDILDKMPL